MTTTTTPKTALELVIAPALDAYSAELEAHRTAAYVYGEPESCTCGYVGKTNSRDRRGTRSVGLHRSAAEKRASKAYDAAAAVALDELSRMTPAQRRELEAQAVEVEPVVEQLVDGPLHELSAEQREHNGAALELVKARRRALADVPRELLLACDRLEATGVFRYFRDGAAVWVELND